MERIELDVELVVVAARLPLPRRAIMGSWGTSSGHISAAPSGPWEIELLLIAPL